MDDVCFILEGTYPFVRGGVSSWTHQLVEAMPDLKFSLLTLSPTVDKPKEYRYPLPDNVTTLIECFLYNVNLTTKECSNQKDKALFWEVFTDFLEAKDGQYRPHFEKMLPLLIDAKKRAVNGHDIIYSVESHTLTERLYDSRRANCPFFDFFWTWRSMLVVFLQTIDMEIPPAKVYHAACTGYAGLVGVVAKMKYNRPLILTEHGIYTKERKIEINQADWIAKMDRSRIYIDASQGGIKDLWIDNFIRLGQLTYEFADIILTLYSGNKDLEIEFGAEASKISIIPNGVDIEKFAPQRAIVHQRLANINPTKDIRVVGLVGRVVPIKDIKMFIKVCKIVHTSMPNVLFQVIGPTDEDEEYLQECLELIDLLGVKEHCELTGPQNLIQEQTYTKLDIMALTSISEGQPLTILEALCVGVPCISTDVGSCSELIFGGTVEDRALGSCGYVVPIGNAEEFALACLNILQNLARQKTMVEVGYQRIDGYYRQEDIVNQYKDLYLKYGLEP